MKKNFDIHIKVSKEQKETLEKRAENIGLSLSSYCLLVMLNAPEKQIISNK